MALKDGRCPLVTSFLSSYYLFAWESRRHSLGDEVDCRWPTVEVRKDKPWKHVVLLKFAFCFKAIAKIF
jgi:hypothetical protein